jgi:hypothetical protein
VVSIARFILVSPDLTINGKHYFYGASNGHFQWLRRRIEGARAAGIRAQRARGVPRGLRLLGVHIVGDNAAEIIHTGQILMNLGGDIRYFIRNVINYPSYSEAYRSAAFNGLNRVHQAGVKYRKSWKENRKNQCVSVSLNPE